ncbi:MocE family 2Fe-2S type ferredoxin [Shinella sp. S4-D37]|uniref:MocE family 2Fe-2S type ferredoxin n=1 Tax=Shinella sp. S4-D37 TaxID=3161999 RepID=UPI003467A96E
MLDEAEENNWISVCAVDDIDAEDVLGFKHGSTNYAIYKSPTNEFFATSGICTHEHVALSDGLVMDHIIECPKHNGRFDYRSGKALGAPACIDLVTYPVRVLDGKVMLKVS